MNKQMKIAHSNVLAVEGKDEEQFFKCLLQYMGITDVDIIPVNGKDNFQFAIPALVRTPGFSNVKAFGVIRDADTCAQAAYTSIRNILQKQEVEGNPLQVPHQIGHFAIGSPKVGIYIMPGSSEKGMLEDLCLQTVKDHPALECVDRFIACTQTLENPPGNLPKARAQTFLACMPKIVNCVGLAANKQYWDFSSDALTELKTFLENFR